MHRPLLFAALLPLAGALHAQEGADRFGRAFSRSDYVHVVPLYDADDRPIDPREESARPYSPARTCGRCHDLAAIAHGWHFSAGDEAPAQPDGRAGEPWIFLDERTGTQIPLSWRGGAGRFRPDALGFDEHAIAAAFARHLPGGIAPPEGLEPASEAAVAWARSGTLEIDCLSCHDAGRVWDHEAWIQQIERGNFAWAPSASSHLATVEGVASKLDAGVDPYGAQGLRTRYDLRRFDPSNQVHFDLVREPGSDACYRCHSTRRPEQPETWLEDGDVHLRAGLSCADCHRNGIEHATVRGYPGEEHPAGAPVAAFSCRGCHLDPEDEPQGRGPDAPRAGRSGAPRPLHAGLPPVHLEKLSCTACHSGPLPTSTPTPEQTSLAHQLGRELHALPGSAPPEIVSPVFARNDRGVLEPQRWTWPAYFGVERAGAVTPFDPRAIATQVRRALRVRKDFRAELADPPLFEEKVAAALEALAALPEAEGGRAVYIANGLLHARDAEGKLERREHPAADAVAWPLAHDVRPARQSLGAKGCQDCHAAGAPFFHATVRARGPAPGEGGPARTQLAIEGLDPELLAAWEQSFRGRDPFKRVLLAAVGVLALAALLGVLFLCDGVVRRLRRREAP